MPDTSIGAQVGPNVAGDNVDIDVIASYKVLVRTRSRKLKPRIHVDVGRAVRQWSTRTVGLFLRGGSVFRGHNTDDLERRQKKERGMTRNVQMRGFHRGGTRIRPVLPKVGEESIGTQVSACKGATNSLLLLERLLSNAHGPGTVFWEQVFAMVYVSAI